jgi:hypothetical protein
MIIGDVMDDVGSRLETIPGLRVLPYEADDVNVPAAMISLPTNLDYSRAYARGMDSITLNIIILVSSVNDRIRRNEITPYGDGSGTKSIKQVLESGKYGSFDTIFVPRGNFDVINISELKYLGIRFVVTVTGQGY